MNPVSANDVLRDVSALEGYTPFKDALIDLRTAAEYKTRHLKGSCHIGYPFYHRLHELPPKHTSLFLVITSSLLDHGVTAEVESHHYRIQGVIVDSGKVMFIRLFSLSP